MDNAVNDSIFYTSSFPKDCDNAWSGRKVDVSFFIGLKPFQKTHDLVPHHNYIPWKLRTKSHSSWRVRGIIGVF